MDRRPYGTEPHPGRGYERDDHGRGGHLHDHGHGHDHLHRGGLLGWVQHTFAHSHGVHEQVDDAMETSERGIWALKISLAGLGATALFQVVIMFLSGSTALLADTIHNSQCRGRRHRDPTLDRLCLAATCRKPALHLRLWTD